MFQLKQKPGSMVKLAPRGHVVAKMVGQPKSNEPPTNPLSAADFGVFVDGELQPPKSLNLYADSTVPSFFRCNRLFESHSESTDTINACRRPNFSPDGALLVSPTGIYRNPKPTDGIAHTHAHVHAHQSFATHIYSREDLATPAISLVGLEDPSVGVRFSPVLYHPIKIKGDKKVESMIPGRYR